MKEIFQRPNNSFVFFCERKHKKKRKQNGKIRWAQAHPNHMVSRAYKFYFDPKIKAI